MRDVGEWGLIGALADRLPRGDLTRVGIGDDAAILAAPDGNVVASVDLLLEGRHFLLSWSSAADVGTKAAARSLADIAAMGATPTGLLVGLAMPPSMPVEWPLDLAAALAAEAARAGATVIGGDTAQGSSVIVSVTALGDLAGRPAVTRGGARSGDVIAVAGRLGHAAAGYALLDSGASPEPGGAGEPKPGGAGEPEHGAAWRAELVSAHLRPQPPYDAGPEAAALGATAMIDVSDGLLADLGHIADASRVRILVESALVEVGDGLAAAATAVAGKDRARPDPLTWVLTGGEDHALAAAFPAEVPLPPRWHVIGSVAEGSGVLVDGATYTEPPGWQHFR